MFSPRFRVLVATCLFHGRSAVHCLTARNGQVSALLQTDVTWPRIILAPCSSVSEDLDMAQRGKEWNIEV
jgi:hypothetical protein